MAPEDDQKENFVTFIPFPITADLGFDHVNNNGSLRPYYQSSAANRCRQVQLQPAANLRIAEISDGTAKTTGNPVAMPNPPAEQQSLITTSTDTTNTSHLQPEQQSGLAPAVPAESIDLEELETFATQFKVKRLELGFTQSDVGLAVGKLYGLDFSQTTISRFEALNLSFSNMTKLRPILQKWLEDTQAALATGTLENQLEVMRRHLNDPEIFRKRKRRTIIEPMIKSTLEAAYRECQRPTAMQIGAVADTLQLEREVIRVWFCNRRQRERRVKSVSTLQNVLNGQAEGDSTGLLLYAQSASANPEPDQQVANTNMSGGAEVTELTEGDDIHLNNLNSTMQLANEVQSINIIQPSDM